MSPTIRQPNVFDVMRLFVVSAIWGAAFLMITFSLDGFGPLSIAALRVSLASVVLLMISVAIKQTMLPAIIHWKKLVVIGLLSNALPFFLISWGQQFISSAESAVLVATGTFCALFLSHISTVDERINWARGIGASVGFCGVVVLVIVELRSSGLGGFKGQLAVMLAGACYAGSSVLARSVTHLPPISTTAAITASASIYMLPIAFIFEPLGTTNPGLVPTLAVIALGVVATALAFVIRFTVIRDNGAVFMTQAGYLVPMFGVVWSWLFLAESVTLHIWGALVLILIGIGITRHGTARRA